MTESEDEDKANSHLAPFNPEKDKEKDKVPENVEWEKRYERRERDAAGGGCSVQVSVESEIDYAPPCITAVIICYPSRTRGV